LEGGKLKRRKVASVLAPIVFSDVAHLGIYGGDVCFLGLGRRDCSTCACTNAHGDKSDSQEQRQAHPEADPKSDLEDLLLDDRKTFQDAADGIGGRRGRG